MIETELSTLENELSRIRSRLERLDALVGDAPGEAFNLLAGYFQTLGAILLPHAGDHAATLALCTYTRDSSNYSTILSRRFIDLCHNNWKMWLNDEWADLLSKSIRKKRRKEFTPLHIIKITQSTIPEGLSQTLREHLHEASLAEELLELMRSNETLASGEHPLLSWENTFYKGRTILLPWPRLRMALDDLFFRFEAQSRMRGKIGGAPRKPLQIKLF